MARKQTPTRRLAAEIWNRPEMRCVAKSGGSVARRCKRRRGHGPNNEHCLQHGRLIWSTAPQTPWRGVGE